MKRSILLREQPVEYTVRKSPRARHIRLSVCLDGQLCVTLPRRVSEDAAAVFIERHADWVLKKIRYFSAHRRPALPVHSRMLYISFRLKAEQIIREKLERYRTLFGVDYDRVTVKYQKSRWGSCSRRGNLNFNYRLVFLPEMLMDYVVVHELCHLREFNHGPRFWSLMERALPNARTLRDELRNQPM